MAHLNFTKVRYRNFLAVGNEWVDIDLNRQPMTLITGQNGAGKTTVSEALVYGIFGKPHRKVKLGQLINIFSKGGMEVEVYFTKGGTPFKVLRGEKPKKFEIWENGELIESKATVREYQKVLDKIVGLDHKMFTQLVVLEKEDFTPFMSLGAAERRKVVEDVLNISVFSVMNKIAGERLKDAKREYDNLEMDIRLKQKDIDGLEGVILSLQQNTDRLVEEKEQQKLSALASCDEKRAAIKRYADEAKPLVEALTDYGVDKLRMKDRKFIEFETEMKTNVRAEQKKIQFFTANPVCPTCAQPMSEDHVSKVVEESNAVVEGINTKLAELATRRDANNEVMQEAQKVSVQLETIKRQGLDLTREYEMLQRQVATIESEIARLKADSDLAPKKAMLAELQSEMAELQTKISDIEKRYDVLKDIQIALKDDGAKAHVISQYMPLINQTLNEYLESMNFNIAFQLNEKFEESFANPARADFAYNNLSNGQKRRVDFGIMLSWLKIGEAKATVSCNVLFIDELFESLDPEGIETLMQVFRDKFKDKNLFVISQRQAELSSHFRNEISFKLDNGFTVVNTEV